MKTLRIRWIISLFVMVMTTSLTQAARANSPPESPLPSEVITAAERGLEGFRHRRLGDPWNLRPDEVQLLRLAEGYEVVTARLRDMADLRGSPDDILFSPDGGRYLFYGSVDGVPKMRMFVDRRIGAWEASTFGEVNANLPGGRPDLERLIAETQLSVTEPLKVFQLSDSFAFWYIAAGEERFMYPMETVSSSYLRELQITREGLIPADQLLRKIGQAYKPVSQANPAEGGGGGARAQPSALAALLLSSLLTLISLRLARPPNRKA